MPRHSAAGRNQRVDGKSLTQRARRPRRKEKKSRAETAEPLRFSGKKNSAENAKLLGIALLRGRDLESRNICGRASGYSEKRIFAIQAVRHEVRWSMWMFAFFILEVVYCEAATSDLHLRTSATTESLLASDRNRPPGTIYE